MKTYAVFAKKTEAAQAEGDYTIWHFLNDTDDLREAFHWQIHAEEQVDTYDDVQIVRSITVELEPKL